MDVAQACAFGVLKRWYKTGPRSWALPQAKRETFRVSRIIPYSAAPFPRKQGKELSAHLRAATGNKKGNLSRGCLVPT
jgi:hypothetical protein